MKPHQLAGTMRIFFRSLIAIPLASAMAVPGIAPPLSPSLPHPPSELEELLTSKDPAKALSDEQFKAMQASDPDLAEWIGKYRAARTAVDLVPLIVPSIYEWKYRSQFKVDKREVAIRKAAASPRVLEALAMIAYGEPSALNQTLAADVRPLAATALDELDAKGQAGFVKGLDLLCMADQKATDPQILGDLEYRKAWIGSLLIPAISESPSVMKRPQAVAFGLVRYFAARPELHVWARSLGFPANPGNTDLARMLAEVDLDGVDALCHVGQWGGPMYGGWMSDHPGYLHRLPSASPPTGSPRAPVFTWELPELIANFWRQAANNLALVESVEKNPTASPAELFVACLLADSDPRRAALGRRAFAGDDKEFENLAPEFRDPVAIDLFARLPDQELATFPAFIREVIARHRKDMAALPPVNRHGR